ncbi:hypothetical protein [Immundisolibacter sp.]
MNWTDLIKAVKDLLLSKDLSDPSIRLRALTNLDGIVRKSYPNIVNTPILLLQKDKNEFKAQLAKVQNKTVLNGAESSIVNNFYQILKASTDDANK